MTTNLRNIPASKLKQLTNTKNGTCTIIHVNPLNGFDHVIMEEYPKAVGTIFSKLFAERFPPINQIKLTNLTKITPSNQIKIVGGQLPKIKIILKWMLDSCDGKGLREFPVPTTKKFTKYYLVKEAAEILSIPFLIDLMEQRMNAIAAIQVHSEDIRCLYAMLGRDHALVCEIVLTTAKKMAKGPRGLKAYNVYVTLAQELKEFGEDIALVLKAAKIEENKESKLESTVKKEQQCDTQKRKEDDKQGIKGNVKNEQKDSTLGKQNEKDANSAAEGVLVKRTIKGELRGNGRIHIALADIGLDGGMRTPMQPMTGRNILIGNKHKTSSRKTARRGGSGSAHDIKNKSEDTKEIEAIGSEEQMLTTEIDGGLIIDNQENCKSSVGIMSIAEDG